MQPDWTPVANIFLEFPGYDCFVCSPRHASGFRLEFFADPGREAVVAPLTPRGDMAGYPGILHGGFQAMLMDEVCGWAALHQARRIVFTGTLQLRFAKPMRTGVPALVCARVEKTGSRLVKAVSWIEAEGERKAEAEGSFYSPTIPEFAAATGADPVPDRYLPYLRRA
ncbi:MAG: PaaI family thioesterase [Thermodesulfobacteriota bacterium]